MKVDLSAMSQEQQEKIARNFRNSKCIICGGEQAGFRKLMLGEQVAFLPLCSQCQNASKQDLFLAMEIADAVTDPNLVQTRRSS